MPSQPFSFLTTIARETPGDHSKKLWTCKVPETYLEVASKIPPLLEKTLSQYLHKDTEKSKKSKTKIKLKL